MRSRRRPRRLVQLGLSARGRGGWRAGAGRPRGRKDHYVPHVPRPRLTHHQAAHVTLRLVDGAPDLHEPECIAAVEAVFAAEREKAGFRLVHYSIRPTHLHLLCEADGALALSRGIQRVASRVARSVNRTLGRRGKLFADRFHGRVVRAPRDARDTLSYVLLNRQKDEAHAGCRAPLRGLDPFSSSAYLAGGWLDVNPRPPPPAAWLVAPPRSWLLQAGWRRHGKLRSDERSELPAP